MDGGNGSRSHGCSFCEREVVGDLYLYHRDINPEGRRISSSRIQDKHLYLCLEHWMQMNDFIHALEGEEKPNGISN